MEEHFTTRQVADALSVSESSVKRWCNRGVIPTVRTVGGHRRIPMEGLARFLEATNRQVQLPMLGSPVADAADASPLDATQLQTDFRESLERGDEAGCRLALSHAFALHENFAQVADEYVASTFHLLGQRWDCGEVEIYQERRGCEICARLVSEFRRLIPEAPRQAPLALGGTPSGDHYSLPSQLVDLVLRERGWRTMNLGPNLPLATVAAAVREHNPRMLWLSISHLQDPLGFADDYRSFRSELPADLTVVLGGRALNDQLRPKLAYTAHCDNLQQLAAFAQALHGGHAQ